MSATEVDIRAQDQTVDPGAEEIHIACMEVVPPKAFCGVKLELHEMISDGDITCVVCDDLMRVHRYCPAKDHCDCQ